MKKFTNWLNLKIFDLFIKNRIILTCGKNPISNTPFFEIHLRGHKVKRIEYSELEILFNHQSK